VATFARTDDKASTDDQRGCVVGGAHDDRPAIVLEVVDP